MYVNNKVVNNVNMSTSVGLPITRNYQPLFYNRQAEQIIITNQDEKRRHNNYM